MRLTPGCGPACVIVLTLAAAAPAAGQPVEFASQVGGGIGGAVVVGAAAPVVGLSVSRRMTSQLGVELDVSYAPDLDLGDFPNCPPDRICVIGGSFSLNARTIAVSAGLVAEIPAGPSWARPYVVAGAGFAHVRQIRRDDFFALRSSSASAAPAVSLGGGVNFRLARRLSVAVETRYQRLFEPILPDRPDHESSLNLTRIGATVSYRF
jgi:opacity protein-like surface antigen